jgi:alkanesulfonate monooxygenase SsuD/methylene tetrahydromethanopterin reductase-like flavin-dependent oxidoreductase (luciferase family)
VVVPLAATPETGPVVSYADTRAFALQAAATGLDSLWLCDHLLYWARNQPTQGIWEAWTILSTRAEATTQAELGTLVLGMPVQTVGPERGVYIEAWPAGETP